MKSIGRNVNIFYFLESLSALAAGMILPLYVVYFRAWQVNLLEVALLAAVFEATVLIFEVPTGVFADRFGRRLSTIIGFLLFAISALIFIKFRSFGGFLVAEVFFGVAETFISGALEALAIESLENKQKQASLFANRTVFRTGAMLAGMVIAGFFAHEYLPYLFMPVLAAFLIAFVLSLALKERGNNGGLNKSDKESTADVLKFIFKKRFVLALFVVGLAVNFVYEGPDQYWQVLLDEIKDINPSIFGLLTAVGLLLVTFTVRPLKRLYDNFALYLVLCLGLAAAALLAVVRFDMYPALVGIVVYFVLKELLRPAVSYQLNRRFNAQNRATYLSFYNLICSVGEVAAGITAGIIASYLGVAFIFGFAALAAIIVIPLFMIISKKRGRAD